jgi:hypothetical protein
VHRLPGEESTGPPLQDTVGLPWGDPRRQRETDVARLSRSVVRSSHCWLRGTSRLQLVLTLGVPESRRDQNPARETTMWLERTDARVGT